VKIGDLVMIHQVPKSYLGGVSVAIVIRINSGRQTSVDVMTPAGIRQRIWDNHLEVINENV